MILEETLVFDSEEDANTFCNTVYEMGGQVKKTFRGVAHTEEVVTCSLHGYINWLSEMIDGTSDTDNPYSENEREIFQKQLNLLTRTLAKLTELLDGKEIGDIIYTREMVQKAILSLLSLPQGEILNMLGSPEVFDIWIPIDIILKYNHIVVESPDGYRLEQSVHPGSLLYQNTLGSDSIVYKKTGISHGCRFSANYSIDPECVVISGPTLYLCDKGDVIPDLLEESTLDLFYENFYSKRQILYSLIDLVTEKRVISLDTLIREMTDYSWPVKDGEEGFAIYLSPIMTKMIVDELMRVKILSGTEKKIRIGKTILRRE